MNKRNIYMLKQNLSYFKNRLKYQGIRLTNTLSPDMVMFEAYSGTKYADSVRAIYEEMLADPSFRSFYFVWAFQCPEDYLYLMENHHTILVRKGTREYMQYYARSRYWINNVSVADYLKPGKHQIYIETWHGTPLKCLGCDIHTDSDPRQSLPHMHRRYRAKGRKVTWFPSPSEYYSEKIASAFGVDKSRFMLTGYPRNDSLHTPVKDISSLRRKYHIPEGRTVLLYAPTWRDSYTDSNGHFTLPEELNPIHFMNLLDDSYFLLFRAHHQIHEKMNLMGHPNILDVSSSDNVNELYQISDMLITDYSSTMFDYAVLKRPMVFYMCDQADYEKEIRGLYLSTEELPGPVTSSAKELADAIRKQASSFEYDKRYADFNNRFNPMEDGHAAKRVIGACISLEEQTSPGIDRIISYIKKMLNRVYLLFLIGKYNVLAFFRVRGLFHNNNSLRLEHLKNIHKGERCFLIGNGPSLTAKDLDLLQDEYTFGTNMVYKIFDKTQWRPTFHCISDSIYGSKLGLELSQNVKSPLFTTERTYRRMRKRPVDTTYVHTIQSDRYKVKGNIQSYCMIKATVLSLAAEMAFHMGFSEIYLLGVDCTNPHGKGGHFTDNYTTKEIAETDINRIKTRMNTKTLTTNQIGKHIIDRSMEVYSLLNEYAKQHDIQIYNATRGGNLEIFPRVKLEDVLGENS